MLRSVTRPFKPSDVGDGPAEALELVACVRDASTESSNLDEDVDGKTPSWNGGAGRRLGSDPGRGAGRQAVEPGHALQVEHSVRATRRGAAATRGAAILVVDDEPPIRRLTVRLLADAGYRCAEAGGEAEALAKVDGDPPDLVLTDVTMPGGSGISLVRTLRERHPDVAAVMLTARDDPEVAEAALDGGAYGYVVKPFGRNELVIAVAGALKRRALALENRMHRERLEELVRQRTHELAESRSETVERLARAVESRDSDTGSHIERMSGLAAELARALGWAEAEAETLRLAALLHDVGKVGIPDGVLNKHGRLDEDERQLIETHAAVGHAILAGARSELLRLADVVTWTHHERFDGSGYPRGLVGEEIPLAGRIAAVADVYDALTSNRAYRPALGERAALALITAGRGREFDPNVVDALLELRA
jgi:putative two-component system response regulator